MNEFNRITSAIFDVLLAPFGEGVAWFDLLFWSLLAGIVAILVYKYASNQAGIARVKNDIKVHLYEIRLFQEDILQVFVSTWKTLGKNALYLGHNLLPMLVMSVPMLAVLFQLEARYAFDPVEVGSRTILEMSLDDRTDAIRATDVTLALPDGVSLDAPPVRTADGEIAWRLRADAPGDYTLAIQVGDEIVEKGLAVGGKPRKVPVMRTKSWEGFLYPGEAGLGKESPVYSLKLYYPVRDLGWLPSGELGILAIFFLLSIVSGFALKGLFGVTI